MSGFTTSTQPRPGEPWTSCQESRGGGRRSFQGAVCACTPGLPFPLRFPRLSRSLVQISGKHCSEKALPCDHGGILKLLVCFSALSLFFRQRGRGALRVISAWRARWLGLTTRLWFLAPLLAPEFGSAHWWEGRVAAVGSYC